MSSAKPTRRKRPDLIKKLRIRLTYITTQLSQTEIGQMSGLAQGSISYLTEGRGVSRSKSRDSNLLTILGLWGKEIPRSWENNTVSLCDLINAINLDLGKRGLFSKPAPVDEASSTMPGQFPANNSGPKMPLSDPGPKEPVEQHPAAHRGIAATSNGGASVRGSANQPTNDCSQLLNAL